MSNLTIKTDVLDALTEVNCSSERDLVFSTGEDHPARAVDAVANTLDLLLQGLALEGKVDLHNFDESGVHQCQACGQIYWGENACSACEAFNLSQEDVQEGEEAEEGTHELTEFQQIFINKVSVQALSELERTSAVWERFNPFIFGDGSTRLVVGYELQTEAVKFLEDEDVVGLLVGLRTPELPDEIWDEFKNQFGDVAYELVCRCTPREEVPGVTVRMGHTLLWDVANDYGTLGEDLTTLEEDQDYVLAALYLKWVSPGTLIPDCIQEALGG
jgi:hypothetical protein